jgi:raffinose/stachyose/melibiose transport system substrate-binding protein
VKLKTKGARSSRLTGWRRNIFIASAALSCAVPCAADASASAHSSARTSSSSADTIVWYNQRPSGGPVDKAVAAVAASFAKSHPGFKLEIETTALRSAYLQKIYTLAAANKLPQLFDEDATPFAQELAREGKLVDIGKWLKKEGLTSHYKPLAMNYDKFGSGKLYAVPLEFAMEFFFYNTAIYKQAGLTPPTTLPQMVKDCKPLAAAGVTPIALDGQDGWPLLRYLAFYPFRMTGNKFVTELAQGKAKMTSAPGRAAANFVASLGKSGCFESGYSSTGYTDALNLFLSGKAATIGDGSWDLSAMSAKTLPASIRGKIGYFKLPAIPGGVTGSSDYVVSSGIGMAVDKATFTPLEQSFLKYLILKYPAVYAKLGQIPAMNYKKVSIPTNVTEPLYRNVIGEAQKVGSQTARPWDTELDPTTTTLVEQDLPLLASGSMSPSAFENAVDQSIAANAPRYFPNAQ